jgi:hypothetical protein
MAMGKYTLAKDLIEQSVSSGSEHGWDREDMLVALIVSAVEDLKKTSGSKVAHQALTYELDNLGGKIDSQFLRSR